LRVLVTRPEAKARRACARLSAMGYQPVSLPLFQPEHFDATRLDFLKRRNWSALAITSSEALSGFSFGEGLAFLADKPVRPLAQRTASIARSTGFTHIITGKGDGQSLARTIAGYLPSSPAASPLLYLAGSPRAPDFENTLHQLGIDFETATVYVMQPIEYTVHDLENLMRDQSPSAVLFYSRAAAQRFFSLNVMRYIASSEKGMRLLCISRKVAEAIPAEFSPNISIAHSPDEPRLLALLAET